MEEANLRLIGIFQLLLSMKNATETELHVGLARCQPYIAHQNVRKADLVLTLDLHCEGATGFACRKINLPMSQPVDRSFRLRVAESHSDHFASRRASPNSHRHSALHNGVIRPERRKRYLCHAGLTACKTHQ